MIKRVSSATVMSKYGCGIKVHSNEISYEILCSNITLARNKVSQNWPKSASKGYVVLYEKNSVMYNAHDTLSVSTQEFLRKFQTQ